MSDEKEKPGVLIKNYKGKLVLGIRQAIDAFEDATGVNVQSAHFHYIPGDPKVLNPEDEDVVDVVLKL